METVAFYSYKGGVGRTLLVANTAQFLAMCGRRVVAVDLDLEAPGLHQKLASRETLARAKSGKLRGVVDELLETIEGKPSHKNFRGALVEIDVSGGAKGSLLVLPAGSAPSHKYWATFERLNGALRSNSREGGLAEAILELQARIDEELSPDFLLIDSRTGITELGGLATSLLADRVVCLTTTAPESIDGTRVVADALRTAPRLKSQRAIQIDFLITRVTGSPNSPHISRLATQLGESVSVLPHDAAIANEERVLSGWGAGHLTNSDEDDAGTELFTATLNWIASSFPVHKDDAERARRRMEVVHRTWRYLTETSERVRGGSRSRDAWPTDQLRERVRFGTEKKSREADIVAYDGPADHSKSKPLMAIEYVEGEDRHDIAQWWISEARVPVVALISNNSEKKLYSRKERWGSEMQESDRWDLPLPHDFKALPNPTDVSVDSLLDAVRRGHPEYLDRIVTEWVHCSAATLHGGAPWRPQVANKILESLARVDDVELARRVLWATSPDPHRSGMWLGDGDDWLDEQVRAELFAPLVWRLPPEASVDILRDGGHRGKMHGSPSGLIAVALLARDLLGLRYDPDASFRIEGQRILDQSPLDSHDDDDRGLYELSEVFRNTEISFEISTELPPLLAMRDYGERHHRRRSRSLTELLSEQISTHSLIMTGLLGNYEPDTGRVVLYKDAISSCADKLALRNRYVGSVVLIHETIHALAHVARDLDGLMWNEFALPPTNTPRFEPSWFHETFAQYFTYHQITKLNDSALMHAFELLSSKQAPAYRAWRRIKDLPIEDARSWFMGVRRGVSGSSSHLRVTETDS